MRFDRGMDPDEAEEYFTLSARFRELVRQAEPNMTGREPLMRYPGDGNRAQRRTMKAQASRSVRRAARRAKSHG